MPITSNSIVEIETDTLKEMVVRAYSGFRSHEAEDGTIYYLYIAKERYTASITEYIVGIMNEAKILEFKRASAQNDVMLSFAGTFIAFAIIIVVGNIILALWSREITKRIMFLTRQVSSLGQTGYKKEIVPTGNDEITDLSNQVERMRQEIEQNERTKQEMFQNLSHDFKTPITVIKSYAKQ